MYRLKELNSIRMMVKEKDIAIIVFTYGRLDHTRITLEQLSQNVGFENYQVFIFSDGPKPGHEEKVESVREYLRKFQSKFINVKVIEREANLGLESSIIKGITELLKTYSAVIVVEDDIKTSPDFLEYMRDMLNRYNREAEIGCISGFNHPAELMKVPEEYEYDIYFAPRTCSWGWATWRDRWDNIDWEVKDIDSFIRDKKKQKSFNKGGNDLSKMLINQAKKGIDTWDIQWCYHNFKKNRLTIYPTISYVENIGMDGTGVHCGKTSGFKNENLNHNVVSNLPTTISIDNKMLRNFKKASSLSPKMFFELATDKIFKMIKSILKK